MIKTCINCKYKDIDYFNEYPCCECDNKSRWEQRKNTNYQPTMKDLMIEEHEKIKEEIKRAVSDFYMENSDIAYGLTVAECIIDKHIAELKEIVDRIEEPVKKALSELKGE